MLFKIDKDCLKALNNKDKNAICALDQLALNRRRCKNVLFAEKAVLESLMKSTYLSETAKNTYRFIFNRSEDSKMCLKTVNRYILIVPQIRGDRIRTKTIENWEQIECQMSLKEIAETDMSDKTMLITENIEDGTFYKIITSHYKKQKNMKMDVDFEKAMGGGSTTEKVLQEMIDRKQRFSLCIVDSDQKFYNKSNPVYGDTMNNIKKIQNRVKEENTWFWGVHYLEVHEVENLIPISWLENLTEDIENAKDGIAFMRKLIEDDSSQISPVFFFDLKHGIPMKKMVENNSKDSRKNELFRQYWRRYLPENSECLKLSEQTHIINGICKNILERVNKKAELLCKELVLEEYLETFWMELGEEIFSWSCVGKRMAG